MSLFQLIQREIMNMLKLLGLRPSSWFHEDDESEELPEISERSRNSPWANAARGNANSRKRNRTEKTLVVFIAS